LDIKIFYKKNGSVVQLIEMEKINEWPLELPFIFVEYIKSNKLRSYRDAKVQAEISDYLNQILNKIALPKLKEIFKYSNQEEILSVLSIFEEVSETNSRAIMPIKDLLENLAKQTDKRIAPQVQKILLNLKE
jgi:hypothetical protein